MRKILLTAALIALVPAAAVAHRGWMVPSSTVLSGEEPWISIDAAISNSLFFADHAAMRLEHLVITGPDGAPVEPQNLASAKYRTTFDVKLAKPGTYRIANSYSGVMARYMANGEEGRWRGTVEDLAGAIPDGASDVSLTQYGARVETFATSGAPTTAALEPVGDGLELAPISHPNDLVVGETAQFRLLLDGRPFSGADVVIAPGGARYRDNPGEFTATTDEDGVFTVDFPSAGLWWINAAAEDLESAIENASRRASYSAVVEVLP